MADYDSGYRPDYDLQWAVEKANEARREARHWADLVEKIKRLQSISRDTLSKEDS